MLSDKLESLELDLHLWTNKMVLSHQSLFLLTLAFGLCTHLPTVLGRSILDDLDLELAIIGGGDASVGEFPWQVSLMDNHVGSANSFCGGVILSPRVILTAAHCLHLRESSDFSVVAGAHSVFDPDGSEQIVGVNEIRSHPEFYEPKFHNDVAIIGLSTSLTYNSRVKPVDIIPGGVTPSGTCTVVGWGLIADDDERNEYPQVLQKVDLDIMDRQACDSIWRGQNPIIPGMICGNRPDKSTCDGDSGSGFICQHGGKSVIAGLVSWGQNDPYCAHDPKYPSVFTDLAYYSSWISQTVADMPA